jgi:predicted flap endonuclease-1-like 5' DNA nuclease
MSYLIKQILLCLIIAAVLGFIIGWILRGNKAKQREHYLSEECDKRVRASQIKSASIGKKASVATSSAAGLAASTTVSQAGTGKQNINQAPIDEYDIEEIEGIGKGRGKRLRKIGISTIKQFLDKYHAIDARKQLADELNLEEYVVGKWVSMADLMRVPGVGSQYSELLEASGVHSVADLASQDANSLATKMKQVNKAEHTTVHSVPDSADVSKWISTAKSLPSKITI